MGGSLSTAVDIILNSLDLGGVFLIVAIGLNIIYGLSRVMNLAHGSLYAVGAYAGFSIVSIGFNYLAAILLAPLVVAGMEAAFGHDLEHDQIYLGQRTALY